MEALGAALAGALVGGLIAACFAERSFRRARAIQEADAVRQEIAVLEGLSFEMEVCTNMACRASPTPLPSTFLQQAIPLCRYMDQGQLADFHRYWQAVLRYNGRVARLIAYGAAKRARGLRPGPEKPESHAREVLLAIPAAYDRIRSLAEERGRRLGGTRGSR